MTFRTFKAFVMLCLMVSCSFSQVSKPSIPSSPSPKSQTIGEQWVDSNPFFFLSIFGGMQREGLLLLTEAVPTELYVYEQIDESPVTVASPDSIVNGVFANETSSIPFTVSVYGYWEYTPDAKVVGSRLDRQLQSLNFHGACLAGWFSSQYGEAFAVVNVMQLDIQNVTYRILAINDSMVWDYVPDHYQLYSDTVASLLIQRAIEGPPCAPSSPEMAEKLNNCLVKAKERYISKCKLAEEARDVCLYTAIAAALAVAVACVAYCNSTGIGLTPVGQFWCLASCFFAFFVATQAAAVGCQYTFENTLAGLAIDYKTAQEDCCEKYGE